MQGHLRLCQVIKPQPETPLCVSIDHLRSLILRSLNRIQQEMIEHVSISWHNASPLICCSPTPFCRKMEALQPGTHHRCCTDPVAQLWALRCHVSRCGVQRHQQRSQMWHKRDVFVHGNSYAATDPCHLQKKASQDNAQHISTPLHSLTRSKLRSFTNCRIVRIWTPRLAMPQDNLFFCARRSSTRCGRESSGWACVNFV